MDIQENIPLAPLTTLQVGGSARFFTQARSIEDVEAALAFARTRDLPVFILGGGSNVLISDDGWPGLVVQIGIMGIEQQQERFAVGAGEAWDKFVSRAVTQNYAGIECLSGIPGSIGGTPVQNVGAYGQEVSQAIVSVLAFDRKQDQVHELSAADCQFSYRTSIFSTTQRERYVILRVTYALHPGGRPTLRYADLQKYFAGRHSAPTLSDVRNAVLKVRASKGMLITPGDPDSRSAGSFFKNPVLSESQYADLVHRAKIRNLQIPSYPALAQQHKVSAAWLVENSGFSKGYSLGDAGISNKHSLAIVNRGHASAAEIIALKEEIQSKIEKLWGLELEPEPVFVDF
ncbi:MAG TPA: UDP-N-acetylmuramate dehydrogenase [Terriglobales bacterium]|nr:UDP-N-acetylmuramate dehydrogenase [Terriglobales bacterium]